MKKQIAIVLTAVVLSVSPVLADPVSDLISDHNMNRMLAGAGEITGQPDIKDGRYVYHLQNVDIVVSANDEKINSFSCVCLNDSGVGEFLAQCATAFYDIGGTDAFIRCYDPLLSEFLAARAGLETGSNKSVPGVLFEVSKLKNGRYIFIVVKVE